MTKANEGQELEAVVLEETNPDWMVSTALPSVTKRSNGRGCLVLFAVLAVFVCSLLFWATLMAAAAGYGGYQVRDTIFPNGMVIEWPSIHDARDGSQQGGQSPDRSVEVENGGVVPTEHPFAGVNTDEEPPNVPEEADTDPVPCGSWNDARGEGVKQTERMLNDVCN